MYNRLLPATGTCAIYRPGGQTLTYGEGIVVGPFTNATTLENSDEQPSNSQMRFPRMDRDSNGAAAVRIPRRSER
jgi:hypothetical protein